MSPGEIADALEALVASAREPSTRFQFTEPERRAMYGAAGSNQTLLDPISHLWSLQTTTKRAVAIRKHILSTITRKLS